MTSYLSIFCGVAIDVDRTSSRAIILLPGAHPWGDFATDWVLHLRIVTFQNIGEILITIVLVAVGSFNIYMLWTSIPETSGTQSETFWGFAAQPSNNAQQVKAMLTSGFRRSTAQMVGVSPAVVHTSDTSLPKVDAQPLRSQWGSRPGRMAGNGSWVSNNAIG